MKIIIPLAGRGTRLRPHTYARPKPLISLAGKPILGHILDALPSDPEEVVFITGEMAEAIEQYVAANYRFQARYLQQEEPKGPAHAVHLAREFVTGPVLITYSDTLFEADLTAIDRTEADGVVFVKEVSHPRRFGLVVLENGAIRRLVEKPREPPSNLAAIGTYYIRDAQFLFRCIEDLLREKRQRRGEFYLTDAFQRMIDAGARLEASDVGAWYDCGTVDALLETHRHLLGKRENQTSVAPKKGMNDSLLVPPVHVARSAKIRHSVVGPYVTIGERSTVQSSVLSDCIVGERTRIENCVLAHSIVGDETAIAGQVQKVNIGDHSTSVGTSPADFRRGPEHRR